MLKMLDYIPDAEIVKEEKRGFLPDSSSFLSLTSKDFYAGVIGNAYMNAYHNAYKVLSPFRDEDSYVETKSLEVRREFGCDNTRTHLRGQEHRERRCPSHRNREGGKKEIVNGVDKK